MIDKRTALLVGAALVVLAFALVPVGLRWVAGTDASSVIRARQELQAQVADVKKQVAAEKAAILAKLDALIAAGRSTQAMDLAARYRLADDLQIQQRYQHAVAQVSRAQTRERIHVIAQRDCTAEQAREFAARAVARSWSVPETSANLSVVQLETREYLPDLRRRLEEFSASATHEAAHDHTAGKRQLLIERLRGVHPPRLHPVAVQELAVDSIEGLPACVWRIDGSVPPQAEDDAGKRFRMTTWMAPSLTERSMEFDVLGFQWL